MNKFRDYKSSYCFLKLKELMMRVLYYTDNSKENYIKKRFIKKAGYEIDFSKSPRSFTQKIQFRKLYDNNTLFKICADKYAVRKYVEDKIGKEYLIPLLLVTEKFTVKHWEKLPNQFVIKATHNSGPVQIIRDKNKADKSKVISEINKQLKIDYGILSMEKYYSEIPRRVIVEMFMENKGSYDLKDFKFYCFCGNVVFCQVIQNRSTNETIDFYDRNWQKMDFIGIVDYLNPSEKNSSLPMAEPLNYSKMIEIASVLSKDFDFVRVDLYEIDGKVYFGELTFCPASGYGTFKPIKWDYILGSYWESSRVQGNR